MTSEQLIKMLQEDLNNEIKHMMFYLRAATEVQGLHREELREFFMKEAHEEMGHVHDFSNMISYLDGSPDYFVMASWIGSHDPYVILGEVVRMEQEVADNYAKRLQATESPTLDPASFTPQVYDAATATMHVFYEDQIKNSQIASWEVKKWLTRFAIGKFVAIP